MPSRVKEETEEAEMEEDTEEKVKKPRKPSKRKHKDEDKDGRKISEQENGTVKSKKKQKVAEEDKVLKSEGEKFSGKILRQSLNSSNGLELLERFVSLCQKEDSKDLAAEYLEAGGSILEILRLLGSSDKKNIGNTSTVFSAMHIVLMKILSQYPQHQDRAREACHHLINSHLTAIHTMLSAQSKPKSRKIVLKLLAAVVSLGGTLPRELLNHLSLHTEMVEFLVSHSKPTDPENVRTCFIHFILAFLVEGNSSDIRTLLEKRGVLSSIFSDLLYDYASVVQLVFTTVKKYVLENSGISKTVKLHVFSTHVIHGIVNLYNWKGPKNWSSHKKQKSAATSTEDVDPEEKMIAVNAVHDFLVTLLTSNKHGIAFHDRKLGLDSSRKNNQLINTVLQRLDKAWEHEKPSDLIVRILTSCPDLIKSQLLIIEPFLVPRVSKKWICVIEFIRKVIGNIDVQSCLKLCSADMTIQQLTNAITNLTLPQTVIKSAIIPSLKHNSPIIHYEIVKLVLVMIRKLESFIAALYTVKTNFTEISILRNNLLEQLSKHIPSFETILFIWKKALLPTAEQTSDSDETDLCVDIKDRLIALLNLLQAYNDVCPEILLISSSETAENRPTLLLTSLNDIPNTTDEELTAMKVKVLKILVSCDMTSFAPKEEIFATALSFLISKIGDGDETFDKEVRQTINLLLNNSGIFENYNDQIEIWTNAVVHIESEDEKLEVANWIAKTVKRVSKNVEKYVSLICQTEVNAEEDIVNINKIEDIFEELSERKVEDVKRVDQMLPITSISLLIYGAIENLKKNSTNAVMNYLSIVLGHTLHCQVSSKPFLSLIETLQLPIQKYLTNWKSNSLPVPLKKPFSSKSPFRNLSKILLSSCGVCKTNAKGTELHIDLDGDVIVHKLTNFEVEALVRMVVFYLTQALRKGTLDVANALIYTDILTSLIKITVEMQDESQEFVKSCLKWFFKHPIILYHFKRICRDEDVEESTVTKLFIDICKLLFEFDMQSVVLHFMQPYQEKFINQINYAVKNYKDKEPKTELKVHMELIKYLQIDVRSTVELLSAVTNLKREKFLSPDKTDLSVWGLLIPECVNSLSSSEIQDKSDLFIKAQDSLLNKLFTHFTNIKISYKQQLNLWEDSLHKYLLKYPHKVAAIDNRIFIRLLESNLTPTTEKILKVFCEGNVQFIMTFIKQANTNNNLIQQKSLVFSILSSNLKYKWSREFLDKVHNCHKENIIHYLTELKVDDDSWIRENVEAIAFLIDNCFDSKSCKEVCDVVLSNGNKLDAAHEGHVKLYRSLFKKSADTNPDALKNFIQLLLHITVTALKRDAKNLEKLNFFCRTLIDTIGVLKKADSNFTFEDLSKSHSWPQFTRISLKSGLKLIKNDKNNGTKSLLLEALVAACDVAYKDNGCEEYVKTIFEMTASHSEFLDVMSSNTELKTDLVALLWTLIRKNKAVTLKNHIPVYLAAYNATMSRSDQIITKILQHYESNDVKFTDYSPFVWGSAAALHYSVKGSLDTALYRESSISQVLDLLVPETIASTIKYFPVNRTLEGDIVDNVENADQIYDPVFYLAVFCSLLRDYNDVACHKVVHSGGLALAIIACSSTCEKVRSAAYTVIYRFYSHLQQIGRSSKEKLLWIHFVETLRNGIAKTNLPLEKLRLNSFLAVFLARATLVMSQPLHPLYSRLHTYVMAKPALDLDVIPEFLPLFHSSEVEYLEHRHWVLEVVRDGFKTNDDMDVALKYLLFKILFSFYNSTLADNLTKNLILQTVRSATKLTKGCMMLVNGYSLLPWLINASDSLKKTDLVDCDSVDCVKDIVNNIMETSKMNKLKENHQLLLERIRINLGSVFNNFDER